MKNNKMKVGPVLLTLALSCAVILGMSGCGAATAAEKQITVSAAGTVRLVPDKAAVSFSVTTQEKTAELAQAGNSEAVNRVMEVLTARGVEEKSIRTVNYSLYPRYDWSESGEQRITGYTVTTSMTVQDQDIDKLGALLSACVEAGINNVDNVSYLCSGYDEAYQQALAQAVEASRIKAEALAAAAGGRLGAAVTITEGWQDTSARYSTAMNSAVSAKEALFDAGGPSFQPGESEITASVTVTYSMG